MARIVTSIRVLAALFLLLAVTVSGAFVNIGRVTHFLGNGDTPGTSDGSGTGPSGAKFNAPAACALDSGNNLFIIDEINKVVRRVAAGSDTTTLFAGQMGTAGDIIANRGTDARFSVPSGLAFLANGRNGYLTDAGTHRILALDAQTSAIGNFVGDGTAGSQEGTSEGAKLNGPTGIAINLDNSDMFVTEKFGHRVRKVTITAATSSFAGSTSGTSGSDDGTGDAARFTEPTGIAIRQKDRALFISDSGSRKVRLVTSDRVVTTVAGTGSAGVRDGPGDVATFVQPYGIVIGRKGAYLYVADKGNNAVRRVDIVTRYVDTVVGNLGAGWTSSLSSVQANIASPRGLCYYVTTSSTRMYITGDHSVSYLTMFHTRTMTKSLRATPAPPTTTTRAPLPPGQTAAPTTAAPPTPAPPVTTDLPSVSSAPASAALATLVAAVTLLVVIA